MQPNLPVHMLWISGELSRLARLSLASFLKHGYPVTLWSYDPSHHKEAGVTVRDANDVLPSRETDALFVSTLFRYRVLAEHGGVWADMDLIARASSECLPEEAFMASERRRPFRHREATVTGESLSQVSNCLMGCASPEAGDLWHRATDHVAALNEEQRSFEAMGPAMLSRLMLEEDVAPVKLLPPSFANPVAWWNVPGYFLEKRKPPDAPFIHAYASIWAKRGVDAETPFSSDTLAGLLWREYGL